MITPLKQLAQRAVGSLRSKLALHGSYQRVFDTPDGEEVLQHILKVGNVTRTCHVAGDPYTTALNEGRRQLALSILRFARKDHGKLILQIERGIEDEANQ